MDAMIATRTPAGISRRFDALRPALRFTSMLLLMLGMALGAIIALVVWVTTPEQLFLGQLTEAATLVQGGDSLASVTHLLRREALSAAGLLISGTVGLIVARFQARHPAGAP
jgi:hypothetical protein